jgi:hypothetical protein
MKLSYKRVEDEHKVTISFYRMPYVVYSFIAFAVLGYFIKDFGDIHWYIPYGIVGVVLTALFFVDFWIPNKEIKDAVFGKKNVTSKGHMLSFTHPYEVTISKD